MTPVIDNHRVDAYLARLGSPEVRHDASGLGALQAAHLMSVPFHNLLLLANDGQPRELQPLQEVVDDAISGIGGNCDRTTPPFTALLHAVGFDARLASATVHQRGDHFICIVDTDDGAFVCDVGNGHPYLQPWALQGGVQEQSFHGWRFRFDPGAPSGPTLQRVLPDGTCKTVYVVDPSPCVYEDFTSMVHAHYTQASFGPFLTGLRAVSIHSEAVLTLRDSDYARDTRFGRIVRRVGGRGATRALLVERFALSPRLVDRALDVVSRRRPDLFKEPRWFPLGRGSSQQSPQVPLPTRAEVPDVLVSLATVGRDTSVDRLLRTLADERKASGYPGRVGVLIVENHLPIPRVTSSDPEGISTHRIHIHDLRPALDRAAEAGVLPLADGALPLSIGAAREAQVAAIRAHLNDPLPGLPHPAEHPTVVWMVDDDMAFQQLGANGVVDRHTNLLFRVARFWSELPQHAVALGTYTGDPPVPGLDCLGGQARDLAENLRCMLAQGPDAAWCPPPSPPPMFDAYYDLSESTTRAESVWPYAPMREGEPVLEVALRLLDDLQRLADGQQLTRPLWWDGTEMAPRPSLRRGGNSVFLELDALFRWPTPVLTTSDGIATRRGDTLWASLAQNEDPTAVVEVTLPLLHGREGQAASAQISVDRAGGDAAAQARGVALVRAIAEGRSVHDVLPAREARVEVHRREVRVRLEALRNQLTRLSAWDDPAIDAAAAKGLEVVRALDELAEAGLPRAGDADELDEFLTRLPEAVTRWRGGW